MSTLRKCLRRPETYLALLFAFGATLLVDACRAPERQFSGAFYVAAVHMYQVHLRVHVKERIVCRFTPTCSEYSVEAVRRFGIAKGLLLTARRLSRCRQTTTPGTVDPVGTSLLGCNVRALGLPNPPSQVINARYNAVEMHLDTPCMGSPTESAVQASMVSESVTDLGHRFGPARRPYRTAATLYLSHYLTPKQLALV